MAQKNTETSGAANTLFFSDCVDVMRCDVVLCGKTESDTRNECAEESVTALVLLLSGRRPILSTKNPLCFGPLLLRASADCESR